MNKTFTHLSASATVGEHLANVHPGDSIKPKGLWFSHGKDWLNCVYEMGVAPQSYAYRYDMDVAPHARILNILPSEVDNLQTKIPFWFRNPDWERISDEYDGVSFLPYSKAKVPLTMMNSWYFGLDIPCLCIWNAASCMQNIVVSEIDYSQCV
jgi:hypothetical protein